MFGWLDCDHLMCFVWYFHRVQIDYRYDPAILHATGNERVPLPSHVRHVARYLCLCLHIFPNAGALHRRAKHFYAIHPITCIDHAKPPATVSFEPPGQRRVAPSCLQFANEFRWEWWSWKGLGICNAGALGVLWWLSFDVGSETMMGKRFFFARNKQTWPNSLNTDLQWRIHLIYAVDIHQLLYTCLNPTHPNAKLSSNTCCSRSQVGWVGWICWIPSHLTARKASDPWARTPDEFNGSSFRFIKANLRFGMMLVKLGMYKANFLPF